MIWTAYLQKERNLHTLSGKLYMSSYDNIYKFLIPIFDQNKKRKHQLSHYKIFVVENYCCRAKWHIIVCLAFVHSSQYLHSQDEKSNQYLLTFPLIQNDFLLQQIISCAYFTSWCYVENTMGHLNLCWDYDNNVE